MAALDCFPGGNENNLKAQLISILNNHFPNLAEVKKSMWENSYSNYQTDDNRNESRDQLALSLSFLISAEEDAIAEKIDSIELKVEDPLEFKRRRETTITSELFLG
jgi:hypothetical protein